jgi:UDP-N-acetylmuramoyl-tripeptide--D-alanyl-D-alanine ligase
VFDWLLWAVLTACFGAGALKWLRVAQREHYIPGRVALFFLRWLRVPREAALAAAAMALGIWGVFYKPAQAGAAVLAAAFPVGLGFKGRTSPLALTRRLATVAALSAAWYLAASLPLVVLADRFQHVPALLGFAAVELGLAVDAFLERPVRAKYLAMARERLSRVSPTVIGVTGSWGKTTAKHLIAHLLSGRLSAYASPASFNNELGIARAINEGLADGTEVFVAEIGAYKKGEIRSICQWLRPRIAVITAIGPVHLERFGSLEAILEAKSEITELADTVVLNADFPELMGLAEHLRAEGKEVVTAGLSEWADLRVLPQEGSSHKQLLGLVVEGRLQEEAVMAPIELAPDTVAVALAVAQVAGVPIAEASSRVASFSVPAHRQAVLQADEGFTIVDDTYNSNPAGAKKALALARRLAGHAPVFVVTPGMVELGPMQYQLNEEFGRQIREAGATAIVVGRTNRRALMRGSGTRYCFDTRQEAVAALKSMAPPGSVVVFENDLPDHFP